MKFKVYLTWNMMEESHQATKIVFLIVILVISLTHTFSSAIQTMKKGKKKVEKKNDIVFVIFTVRIPRFLMIT